MPRIGPSPAASPNPSAGTGIDAAGPDKVGQHSPSTALDRRLNEEMHRDPDAFSKNAPALGALDGLVPTTPPREPASSTAAMASRVPLPPPMPPKGFNHPRPAVLSAPTGNPKLHATPAHEAAHLGHLDPLSGAFVGTGQWDGANKPPTAWPGRTTSLQEHEYQQAGYQLAARLVDDPVEHLSDLVHLRLATQTMHDTRTELKYGRGNVRVDIEKTKHISSALSAVPYQVSSQPDMVNSVRAGMSLALGAGTCDRHSVINTRSSARMLIQGETVDKVSNDNLSHTWSQINQRPRITAEGRAEPRPTIVIDSWADGPAVRLGDSIWAPGVASTSVNESFDRASGTQQLDVMNQARADTATPGGPLNVFAVPFLKKLVPHELLVTVFPHGPVIVSTSFSDMAQEKLMTQSSFARELMSVAAVRQAYNLHAGEATKLTTSIATLQAVMTLDRPTRPAIEDPTAAGTAVPSAASPISHDQEPAKPSEIARSAKNTARPMPVLDQKRDFPPESDADLLTEQAYKVADIAQWKTSSHQVIQKAAPDAEKSFRQVLGHIADLPPALQAKPLYALGRQLRALPFADRLATMNAILAAPRNALSEGDRLDLLMHLSKRLAQFHPKDLPRAVDSLLDEARLLSNEPMQALCRALHSALKGTMAPEGDRAAMHSAIEQMCPGADAIERPQARDLLRFSGLARQT